MFNRILIFATLIAIGFLPVSAQSTDVFISGPPIHGGTMGMTFDDDGNLWVASVMSNTISMINPETGEILKVYGIDQGIVGPDDVAFGPDGSLFWTSVFGGVIGRIMPDGEMTIEAQVPTSINSLAFSEDGRLFAGQCIIGNNLYEIYPDQDKEPRLIIEEMGPGCSINSFDVDPDGMLYGPQMFLGTLSIVDPDTGEYTTLIDDLTVVSSVKFDSTGALYLVDYSTSDVYRANPTTGEKEVIATLPPGVDGLVFDQTDRLYAASYADGIIVEILNDGSIRTVIEGGVSFPGGLAVIEDSLYVADLMALRQYDIASGDSTTVDYNLFVTALSPTGAPGTVDPMGDNLVLSSWFDNAVRIWDPINSEIVVDLLDVAAPLNAVDFDGDLIIAELGTGSVVRASGTDFADRTAILTDLAVPAGLATDGNDLYVGDWATGMVWQAIANGEVLDAPRLIANDLVMPEGMTLLADGRLAIVETGMERILAVNPADGTIEVLAENAGSSGPAPEGMPPTWIFNGIAVDADGTIYVSDEKDNTILQIK